MSSYLGDPEQWLRNALDGASPSALAGADQLGEALREVGNYGCRAVSLSAETSKLRVKCRFFLKQHRLRMAEWPVMEDGVLGGLDGDAIAGNDDAQYLAPRGSRYHPVFDPYDPAQRNTPIVLMTWNLNHELIVRSPDAIADVIEMIHLQPDQPCDWCMGPQRPDSTGVLWLSLLVLTSGQYVVLVPVCSACRERLVGEHGDGLRWVNLTATGRVIAPVDPASSY